MHHGASTICNKTPGHRPHERHIHICANIFQLPSAGYMMHDKSERKIRKANMSLRHDPRPFTFYMVTFAAGEGKKATRALEAKNKKDKMCALQL